jgi:tetratricopeptide (TPR) repeat protein
MKIARSLLMIIIAAGFVSCSSAPPQKEEEIEQKNQAAQYAETGNKYYNQGLYEQALGFFRLSLSYNSSVYNERGMIESYNSIGKTYIATDSFDLAQTTFAKAMALARLIDDKELIATCLDNSAELSISKKDYDKALGLLQDAIAISAGIKPARLAVINHNLGIVYRRLGKLDLAISHFQLALSANLSIKNYHEVGSNYYMLSSSYSEKGDLKTAIDYAQKALSTDKKFENSLGILKDFYAIGILSAKLGKDDDAFVFFRSGLVVCESLIAIRPSVDVKDQKRALLDSLIPLAQKREAGTVVDDYVRMRKELDR